MSVSCTSTSGKYTEMGCVNVSIMVMVMVTRMEMRVRLVKGSKTCFIEHNSKHPSPIEEYCCSSMPLMKVQQQKLWLKLGRHPCQSDIGLLSTRHGSE